MSPIEINAFAVLSRVAESGVEELTYAQVIEQTRLNEKDFNRAIDYLLQLRYIHPNIGSVELTIDGEMKYHELKQSTSLKDMKTIADSQRAKIRRPSAVQTLNQRHREAYGSKNSKVEQERVLDPAIVFVAHGRNEKARQALFMFLRAIGMKPREFSEWVVSTGQGSPYEGDVLRTGFQEAHAFVILMTPDDEARLREPLRGQDEETYERLLTPQPRPNVIFEAGMAMAFAPSKTIIVQLGKLRPMSNILGRDVVKLNNSTEKRKDLAQRLRSAGCPVNTDGTDWLNIGDFEAAIESL